MRHEYVRAADLAIVAAGTAAEARRIQERYLRGQANDRERRKIDFMDESIDMREEAEEEARLPGDVEWINRTRPGWVGRADREIYYAKSVKGAWAVFHRYLEDAQNPQEETAIRILGQGVAMRARAQQLAARHEDV